MRPLRSVESLTGPLAQLGAPLADDAATRAWLDALPGPSACPGLLAAARVMAEGLPGMPRDDRLDLAPRLAAPSCRPPSAAARFETSRHSIIFYPPSKLVAIRPLVSRDTRNLRVNLLEQNWDLASIIDVVAGQHAGSLIGRLVDLLVELVLFASDCDLLSYSLGFSL